MIKSTLVLLAMIEEAVDYSQEEINEMVTEWCLSFKEKLVMLFVNTFVFGVEKEFLNGQIFQDSLRIKTEEQWKSFAKRIGDSKLL